MKKKFLILFVLPIISLLISSLISYNALAEEQYVYLGGHPAGFTLYTRGATVVGLCDVVCGENIFSPSKDSGIEVGDIILTIDDYEINSAKDIEVSLKNI